MFEIKAEIIKRISFKCLFHKTVHYTRASEHKHRTFTVKLEDSLSLAQWIGNLPIFVNDTDVLSSLTTKWCYLSGSVRRPLSNWWYFSYSFVVNIILWVRLLLYKLAINISQLVYLTIVVNRMLFFIKQLLVEDTMGTELFFTMVALFTGMRQYVTDTISTGPKTHAILIIKKNWKA